MNFVSGYISGHKCVFGETRKILVSVSLTVQWSIEIKDRTIVEKTRPYFTMIWHNLETAMELQENSIL